MSCRHHAIDKDEVGLKGAPYGDVPKLTNLYRLPNICHRRHAVAAGGTILLVGRRHLFTVGPLVGLKDVSK